MSYQRIRRYLQSPGQIVHREILAEPVERLLRDCNIPEDPNWPSPINYEEAQELMSRLPRWAMVVCAVTAAEMVLPIWDDWAEDRDDLDNQEKESPRRAIDAAQQWLDEKIDIVSAAYIDITARAAGVAVGAHAASRAAHAYAASRAAHAYAASRAAYAGADAARAARAADGVYAGWAGAAPTVYAAHAADTAARAARAAVFDAVYAADAAYVTDAAAADAADAAHAAAAAVYTNFYLDWWRVCRCRLSFILEARTLSS